MAARITAYCGLLVDDCPRYIRGADSMRAVFHHHENALFAAKKINQRANTKIKMVVVRDGHFYVVAADPLRFQKR